MNKIKIEWKKLTLDDLKKIYYEDKVVIFANKNEYTDEYLPDATDLRNPHLDRFLIFEWNPLNFDIFHELSNGYILEEYTHYGYLDYSLELPIE